MCFVALVDPTHLSLVPSLCILLPCSVHFCHTHTPRWNHSVRPHVVEHDLSFLVAASLLIKIVDSILHVHHSCLRLSLALELNTLTLDIGVIVLHVDAASLHRVGRVLPPVLALIDSSLPLDTYWLLLTLHTLIGSNSILL